MAAVNEPPDSRADSTPSSSSITAKVPKVIEFGFTDYKVSRAICMYACYLSVMSLVVLVVVIIIVVGVK